MNSVPTRIALVAVILAAPVTLLAQGLTGTVLTADSGAPNIRCNCQSGRSHLIAGATAGAVPGQNRL